MRIIPTQNVSLMCPMQIIWWCLISNGGWVLSGKRVIGCLRDKHTRTTLYQFAITYPTSGRTWTKNLGVPN